MEFILPKLTTKVLKFIETFALALLTVMTWVLNVATLKSNGTSLILFDVISVHEHSWIIDAIAIAHLFFPLFAMLFLWLGVKMARKIKFLRDRGTRNRILWMFMAVGILLCLLLWFFISSSSDCDLTVGGLKGHPIFLAIFYLLAMIEPFGVNFMNKRGIRYGTAATYDGIADTFRRGAQDEYEEFEQYTAPKAKDHKH